MKSNITFYGLAASILLGGSLAGQTDDANVTQQTQTQDTTQTQTETQTQDQVKDQVQHQLGPLADQLTQLRLDYREQVLTLLEERERLIRLYRLATEEEKMAIRKQLREHQATIAETHRMLRRQLRDQIRDIRDNRRKTIQDQGG